jgi:hypothetical protein
MEIERGVVRSTNGRDMHIETLEGTLKKKGYFEDVS